MPSPSEFYRHTFQEQTTLAEKYTQRYERLALVRLVVFIAWLAAVIVLITTNFLWGLGFLVLTTPALVWGVRHHLALRRAGEEATILAGLADGESRALNHDFGHFADGKAFLDPAHPYALDLDIFGRHSLFQYVNRTVTAPGQARLAEHLLLGLNKEDRARTQVQGKVLGAMPDWCLNFRTIGHELNDDIRHFERLLTWLDRPAVVSGRWESLALLLAPFLSLASVAYMLLVGPWYVGALGLVPAILMLRKYKEIIPREHAYTAEMGTLLSRYAALLDHTATLPGEQRVGEEVSPALRTLSYRISQLDVRYNPFVMFLELGGLWSLQWLRKLDRWRAEYREGLPQWLDTLAETDALVSWATLRHNQPDWTDAEWTSEPIFEARSLGHPLLSPAGRVTNDLSMRTDGHIHLVTGSNMAGKSTWLRTVGINIVLANAGAPTCSLHLRLRPLQVWTSMRTQDDLSESTSSFYAELKRLKAIIGAVSDPDQQVFFLLDEILKGTNSRDRHTGSRALIRQLIRERGAGIIATHDLELAALENEPGSRVENYAMEVQTDGDQLTFDYKLHPGVCQSFNATALMARMGIDIPEEEIKLRHD